MRDGAEGRDGLRGEEELRREAGRRGQGWRGLEAAVVFAGAAVALPVLVPADRCPAPLARGAPGALCGWVRRVRCGCSLIIPPPAAAPPPPPGGGAAKGGGVPPKASGVRPHPRVSNPRRRGPKGGGAPAH